MNPKPALLTVIGLVTTMLSGCWEAHFEDISNAEEHRDIVGMSYITVSPLLLSGVNLPPGYGDSVDICYLERTSPTWAGPELISRTTIEKGTLFTVLGAEQCTNCYFDFGSRIQYRIELECNGCEGVAIYIRKADFSAQHVTRHEPAA